MEYEKLQNRGRGPATAIAIVSLVVAVAALAFCGGLAYKSYDLQRQLLEVREECSRPSEELADASFNWTTGDMLTWPTNFDVEDDEDEDEDEFYEETYYDDLDYYGTTSDSDRFKREILMRTSDGVPVNSESYKDVKKNKTESSDGPAMYVRKSRVMHQDDKTKAFKKIIKKPLLKSRDLTETVEPIPHKRRHRQRRVEPSYPRFRPAIHVSGDVHHSNGWTHHEADHYKNWSRDSWVRTFGMDQYFHLENGQLRIAEPGLYLVYAQVLYFDEHDTNGFYVYKNDDVILQCTTTSHTSHRVRKSNTCYTAGMTYLSEGDKLKVHDIESYRYSIFRPGKSFFGAVKLSDVRKLFN